MTIIQLSETHHDALAEVLNIAFGRTAASLSTLTAERITLEPPRISLHPVSALAVVLSRWLPHEVMSVHQVFGGPVAGDALMLLSPVEALRLVDLLVPDSEPVTVVDGTAREVLTEVGNILLSACLSTFGDLLAVQVSFSIPYLRLAALPDLLGSIDIAGTPVRTAVVVTTGFGLRDADVRGYLVIVLGISSVENLIAAAERLAAE